MTDDRLKKLAYNLVNYSCRLQKGEKILIDSRGDNDALVRELVKATYEAGGMPFVWYNHESVTRELAMGYTEEQVRLMMEVDSKLMEAMDAYVAIRGGANSSEMSDVPHERMELYSKIYSERVHSDLRVDHTKWVVIRYPSPSMAQMANMSTAAFEDYYFSVCCLDYSKMDRAMDALKALMERTDKVRVTGKDTDISFSIKGLPAIKCSGQNNIPDGEIYTAPVMGSINGVITYNTPTLRDGFTFENVQLTFRDGRIVKATANDTERINRIFDMDEGARGVGEFSIGINPFVTEPMKDTLFDEKICGSIHFTPGNSYTDCDNGNHSALHWDMVLIQRPEYGGGEIYFDGVLIRKGGRFVIPELDCLNPENLM